MGKRILVQRRGKGGMQYRAPTKGKISPARYPKMNYQENHIGKIDKIVHERGRDTPLTRIKLDDGTNFYTPAVTGLELDSEISIGNESEIINGNILQLLKIPDGTQISNIEIRYGDGGKLIRAAGSSALLISHSNNQVSIKLSSGELKLINELCRATIGKISGGGRSEKPFLKAGNKAKLMTAKGQLYPRVRGMAMASVYHPFGGGRHQHSLAESRTTSRNAPPGRKVGSIAARRTGPSKGRAKRKRV